MRDGMIALIRATQKAVVDGNFRLLMSIGCSSDMPTLQFGSGYFDVGKVMFDGRTSANPDDGVRVEMEVEAAVDRFLAAVLT